MILAGRIEEFAEGLGRVQVVNEEVILWSGDGVRVVRGKGIETLCYDLAGTALKPEGLLSVVPDGVWWIQSKPRRATFVDVFDKGLQYPEQCGIKLDQGDRSGEWLIGRETSKLESGEFRTRVVLKHLFRDEVKHSGESDYGLNQWTDGEFVYAFSDDDAELRCLDTELRVRWRQPVPARRPPRSLNRGVNFVGDQVVVADVFGRSADAELAAVAFHRETGERLWETRLPGEGGSGVNRHGERLYAALDDRMVVLDLTDGRVVVDEPSGFPQPEVGKNRLTVFTDGEHILAAHSETLRVFSGDGRTLLDEVELPTPPTPFVFGGKAGTARGHYKLRLHMAAVHAGRVYVPMEAYKFVAGLLILEPSSDCDGGGITVSPRLPARLETVPDGRGLHGYRLSMGGGGFDRLLRHAKVQLAEVAQYLGQIQAAHDHFDPLFNGRITLSVASREVSADGEEELGRAVEVINQFCRMHGVYAPAMKGSRKSKWVQVSLDLTEEIPSLPEQGIELDDYLTELMAEQARHERSEAE
ncbi:outer membrane protein assembly factor BamB family protein [Arhodomonas sp. AD133]|uniref:outer membrane protein assembly factor BamB family protein n=1 Tax=Arhodomonas sp. AD133 TaxID=3415009 RepID=UPI003EBB6F61